MDDYLNRIDDKISSYMSIIGGYIEKYTTVPSNKVGYYIWCLGTFILLLDFLENFKFDGWYILGLLCFPILYIVNAAMVKCSRNGFSDTITVEQNFVVTYRINMMMFLVGMLIGHLISIMCNHKDNNILGIVEVLIQTVGAYLISSKPIKPVENTSTFVSESYV